MVVTDEELPASLAQAITSLAASPVVLVALDFDGTLAPFVDDPAQARVAPRAAAAIARLSALPRTFVAYISGRPLESLARVTEAAPDDLLVGSHGVELRLDGRATELDLEPGERELLTTLDAELVRIVAAHPGAHLERKPVGLGLHLRLLTPDAAASAHAAALEAAARLGDGLTARDGKDILEFAVRGATKGDGVRRLREHVGASAVLFAGDDVTDEDGFLALEPQDVGVKVGDGVTAASHRVDAPDRLAAALALLAALRTPGP